MRANGVLCKQTALMRGGRATMAGSFSNFTRHPKKIKKQTQILNIFDSIRKC